MIFINFGRVSLAPATPPEATFENLAPETLENEKSLSPTPLAQHIRALGADGKRGGSMPTRPWAVARAYAARYARLARKEMDRDSEMLGADFGVPPRCGAPWRVGTCCAPPVAARGRASARSMNPNPCDRDSRPGRSGKGRVSYPARLWWMLGCRISDSYGSIMTPRARGTTARQVSPCSSRADP